MKKDKFMQVMVGIGWSGAIILTVTGCVFALNSLV